MSILDRYILRQLIFVTFIGVASLTALLLLGQIFKELQELLVESGAPPTIVIDFMLQVIPFSLSFSLPWGFLTAVLLVYGRLASDNELTSMRMAGLSLWRLSVPAIFLGLVLSLLCYYINIQVAPRSKQAMTSIVLDAAKENPKNLLSANSTAIRLGDFRLYIEKRDDDVITGLHVYPEAGNTAKKKSYTSLHAQKAIIGDYDAKTRRIELTLLNVIMERRDAQSADMPIIEKMPLYVTIPTSQFRRLKDNRYTNAEIEEALTRYEELKDIDMKLMPQLTKASKQAPQFPTATQLWSKAQHETRHYKSGMNTKTERAFRTERTKRLSFSVACIVFSLIGVPLAITSRRKDTTASFGIGIGIAALYFLALTLCELTRKSSGITPYIALWVPNVVGLLLALRFHQTAKHRG